MVKICVYFFFVFVTGRLIIRSSFLPDFYLFIIIIFILFIFGVNQILENSENSPLEYIYLKLFRLPATATRIKTAGDHREQLEETTTTGVAQSRIWPQATACAHTHWWKLLRVDFTHWRIFSVCNSIWAVVFYVWFILQRCTCHSLGFGSDTLVMVMIARLQEVCWFRFD